MSETDLDALRILRDALDTRPDERDAYLSARCGADTNLHGRVVALLRNIVDETIANRGSDEHDTAQWTLTAREDPMTGHLLGPFRVIERVGRGGMGVVYRGQREGADFQQEVAIKLIRRGFDFDDIRARFLRERRILARLSHPNLARFIDGGVADDGRPWFALEFVRGQMITNWCDQGRLAIRPRIRLFLDVCTAVQYAHTQFVVHRDLKPANVLVDDSGGIRLLDFGIAKLVDGDDDGLLPGTLAGARSVLTPEYAAPEQLTGGEVGIGADIYSLGVIAYQLIAGVLPRVTEGSDRIAIEHAMRATSPQPLAQAIGRDEGAFRRLGTRDTTARAYRSDVRGDLNRIVDKALLDEPSRRYATVQAFADDLSRWLEGRPVQVSGNPFGYRLAKFFARNRVAVGLATLLVVCVLVAGVGMAWQLLETRRQANAALQMKDHLVDLIGQLDNQQAGSAPPTLLHIAEQSVAQLENLEPGSALRRELAADVVRMLKRVDQPMQALRIVERELGSDPGRNARNDTVRLRQTAAWAEALLYWDRPDEAWEYLAQSTAHHGDASPMVLADALSIQAEVENSTGRFVPAIKSGRHALAILQESLPASDTRIADVRFALAAALVGIRDDAGGRAQSERVLVDLSPRDSKARRFALTKAAMRRSLFGDFGSAEAAYAEGAAMAKRLTSFAPHRFDEAMRAVNLFDLGELGRARALVDPIRRANNTPGSSDIWEPWSTEWLIGEIALVEGRPREAAESFGEAARMARQQGTDFDDFALYNESLDVIALTLDGQIETARGALETADTRVLARPSFATAMRAAARGVWFDHNERFDDAVRAFDVALDEMKKADLLPIGLREQLMEHRDAVRVRIWQQRALSNAGKPARALAASTQAHDIGIRTLGATHPFMRAIDSVEKKWLATQTPHPPRQ